MDNLKSPAYPQLTYDTVSNGKVIQIPVCYTNPDFPGFTKLERASLLIAAGITPDWYSNLGPDKSEIIAQASVRIAKAVLEEANK